MTTAADYLRFDVQQLITDYKLRTRTAPSQEVTVTNITDVFIITALIEDTFEGSSISPNQLVLGPRESKTFRITYDIGLLESLPVGSIPANITVTATAEPIQLPPPPPPPPIEEPPPPPIIIRGCTNSNAFNYTPFSNVDDGSCIPKRYGCTNPQASNYDPNANIEAGTCQFPPNDRQTIVGCTNRNSLNYNPDAEQDDGSCIPIVVGCLDVTAQNYNPEANRSGECKYRQPIEGCMDRNAKNYNALATVAKNDECDYDVVDPVVYGCMDKTARNYNPVATQPKVPDDCQPFPVFGCMNRSACNYSPGATEDDGSCQFRNPCVEVRGCTNPTAKNYIPAANVDDGSCEFNTVPEDVLGCTDRNANNYNSLATKDDGSCTYDRLGCTNRNAYNYNSNATRDDGSCVFVKCLNPDALNYEPGPSAVPCPNDTCCQFRCGNSGGQVCNNIGTIVSTGPRDSNGFALVCRNVQRLDANGCYAGCEPACLNEFIGKPDVEGCRDPLAKNYNPDATKDDGKCEPWTGCTNRVAKNYNPRATLDDGSCQEWKLGCMDTSAKNYDATAEVNLPSLCIYPVYGCTNRNALNYDPRATDDDGSCKTRQISQGGTTVPDCISDEDCSYVGLGGVYRRLVCQNGRCGDEVVAEAMT